MSASYESVLGALAVERPDLLVMTAENRAPIRNLPQALGPRFLDVGICEQTLIGAAAGLALRGRTPVVHALAAFLTMRAFEFVRTDVGIAGLPVKMVGYVPGFLSEANGPTHQAIEDVALMRGIPGVDVICPSDGVELAAALPAAVASPRPCYIRYNPLPPVVTHRTPFRLGRAEVLSEGDGVALLTYGVLLGEADRAGAILAEQGVPVRLVDLRTLSPLDEEAVVAAARQAEMVVTIEDHFKIGGLYSMVAEVLLRHGISRRVHPISLGQRWFKPAL
ncbi:MAG TPA: transketolase C-terminal domain-containing protein, partial [Thermoanaerobaculia bacterium]|nr:transketolase C-terminal domain-containing protein [Thermoanaerobaculia bacterium]